MNVVVLKIHPLTIVQFNTYIFNNGAENLSNSLVSLSITKSTHTNVAKLFLKGHQEVE